MSLAIAGDRAVKTGDGFWTLRSKTIQAQLEQVGPNYIMLLGDSHVERAYLSQICGAPVLNAGISGATVRDVLELTKNISITHKPAAIILSVGTNDIWAARHPKTHRAQTAFTMSLAALRQRLSTWTDHLIVVDIPPVAKAMETAFPRDAAQRYAGMLRDRCALTGCKFLELYAETSSDTVEAGDGVHLIDYSGAFHAKEREICQFVHS